MALIIVAPESSERVTVECDRQTRDDRGLTTVNVFRIGLLSGDSVSFHLSDEQLRKLFIRMNEIYVTHARMMEEDGNAKSELSKWVPCPLCGLPVDSARGTHSECLDNL